MVSVPRAPANDPVLAKLDLPDRIHTVIYAYETGIVQPGETGGW
jgi:hypothetical protein